MRICIVERLFHRPFGLRYMHPEGFAIVNFASQLPGGRDGGRCYYLRFAKRTVRWMAEK